MIMMFDGGIRKPSVPAPARLPIARRSPRSRGGRAPRARCGPPTCVVAAEEPEMAAKIEQPTMLTCSSRPGSSPIIGASPSKSERDSRVRNRISPITMKSGRATSSEVVRMFQAYCGSSLSSGMSRKSASRTMPRDPQRQPDPDAARQQPEQDRGHRARDGAHPSGLQGRPPARRAPAPRPRRAGAPARGAREPGGHLEGEDRGAERQARLGGPRWAWRSRPRSAPARRRRPRTPRARRPGTRSPRGRSPWPRPRPNAAPSARAPRGAR